MSIITQSDQVQVNECARELVKALQFYADPLNYFGAPAPVYSDSGKRAHDALAGFASSDDWWVDPIGLDAKDIEQLRQRLGDRLWDGVIHLGGINSGVWLPWPGEQGNCVRDILRLYQSRAQFKADSL